MDGSFEQTPVKNRSLLRSTGVVASMTMLSRILGFARDMLIAHFFGAGAGVDAFFIAFKIPNFMRRLFAEGAFSQAFVPVLAEYQVNNSHEDVKQFISRISGNLAAILSLVTLFALLFSPLIISVFAPGFLHDPHRFALASDMLRITFPYLLLISLVAVSGAVLNTYGIFSVPAFTPVLLNVAMITAIVFGSRHFDVPVTACAWGVFWGGVIQLLFQLPFLWKKNLLQTPTFFWQDPGVKRVLKLMVPALFGVSVAQVNLLLDTLFASFLPPGSVSWLFYSDRLMNFPLGVFGVAISTVILPNLSRQFSAKSDLDYTKTIDWAIRSILIIALPSALGLALLAGPLLTTLFNYGAFTTHDVNMTTRSLLAFSLGVPAFMLIKVLAASFYGRQDIKTPVKIGVIAMICNSLLNLALIFPLAHAGLALATSLSAFLNAGCLVVLLIKRDIYRPAAGWMRFAFQLLCANGAMACLILLERPALSTWFTWHWQQRFSHLLLLVFASAVLYVITLAACGVRVRDFRVK